MRMRIVLVAFALLSATGSDSADAAAWCAFYTDNAGTNCGFYTLQQCQAATSGVGGYCAPNPESPPAQPPARRRAR
jgi:hypothetical protein